jgi:tripartite-type tricarboxylate transporter receptor subunit TctC
MIHLLGERWSRKVGAPLTHVPYRRVPPAIQDLVGRQVDLSFIPLGGFTAELVESGRMRVYDSTGGDRAGPMSQAELDRYYQGEIRLYQALARELGVLPQ